VFRKILSVAGILALVCAAMTFSTIRLRAETEATFVALTVDGEPRGDTLIALRDDAVALDSATVTSLNVAIPANCAFDMDGHSFVPVASITAITTAFDRDALTLAVSIINTKTQVVALDQPAATAPPAPTSVYANYSATDDAVTHARVAIDAVATRGNDHLRVDGASGGDAGVSTAVYEHDNVRSAQSIRAGSLNGEGDALIDSAQLVGVSVERDATLQPEHATYSRPTIDGIATEPGVADVYVDGTLVRSVPIGAGPYAFTNIPTPAGGGRVSVVLRGIDGEVTHIERDYSADPSLLAKGTTDYRYAAGVDPLTHTALAEGDYRIGLSTATTVSANMVTSRTGTNAEGGLDVSIAKTLLHVGVAEGSLGGGLAASLRAPLANGSISADIVHRMGATSYSFDASHRVSESTTVSATVSRDAQPTGLDRVSTPNRIETVIGIQRRMRGDAIGSLTFERDHEPWQPVRNQIAAAMTFRLGARSADVSRGTITVNGGSAGTSVEMSSEGSGSTAPETMFRYGSNVAAASYALRTPVGTFGAALNRYGSDTDLSLQAQGAFAYIDGHVGALAHVDDGFGLVEIEGAPGATVSLDNRVIGRTSKSGLLFINSVPTLLPGHVDIDYADLRLDQEVDATSRSLLAPRMGGSVARFYVHDVNIVEGIIAPTSGDAPPYGGIDLAGPMLMHLRLDEHGRFAADGLKRGIYRFIVRDGAYTCRGSFMLADAKASHTDLGKLTCAL
jgi:outer membrane usher protein